MQLLRKNPIQDMFLSIELIKAGFVNGDSYETVLKQLSQRRYGKVSEIAEQVFKDILKGVRVSESIESRTKGKSETIKRLFNSIALEEREESAYDDLNKSILDYMETNTKVLLESVESFFKISIFLVFVPFIIMIIDYMHSIGLGDIFGFISVLKGLESAILISSGAVLVYFAVRINHD